MSEEIDEILAFNDKIIDLLIDDNLMAIEDLDQLRNYALRLDNFNLPFKKLITCYSISRDFEDLLEDLFGGYTNPNAEGKRNITMIGATILSNAKKSFCYLLKNGFKFTLIDTLCAIINPNYTKYVSKAIDSVIKTSIKVLKNNSSEEEIRKYISAEVEKRENEYNKQKEEIENKIEELRKEMDRFDKIVITLKAELKVFKLSSKTNEKNATQTKINEIQTKIKENQSQINELIKESIEIDGKIFDNECPEIPPYDPRYITKEEYELWKNYCNPILLFISLYASPEYLKDFIDKYYEIFSFINVKHEINPLRYTMVMNPLFFAYMLHKYDDEECVKIIDKAMDVRRYCLSERVHEKSDIALHGELMIILREITKRHIGDYKLHEKIDMIMSTIEHSVTFSLKYQKLIPGNTMGLPKDESKTIVFGVYRNSSITRHYYLSSRSTKEDESIMKHAEMISKLDSWNCY